MLERSPMIKLSKKKQLVGFKHNGFCSVWIHQEIKNFFKNLINKKKAPWMN